MDVSFVPFDEVFLDASWNWLQDEELRVLIDTSPVTKEEQRAWFNHLSSRTNYVIWGVRCEQEPVGVCGLKHISSSDAEYWGYIGEKKYRGKGIGTIILRFVEQQAVVLGIGNVYLHVLKSNAAAIGLYQKHQYKTINETDRMLLMQKQLHTT